MIFWILLPSLPAFLMCPRARWIGKCFVEYSCFVPLFACSLVSPCAWLAASINSVALLFHLNYFSGFAVANDVSAGSWRILAAWSTHHECISRAWRAASIISSNSVLDDLCHYSYISILIISGFAVAIDVSARAWRQLWWMLQNQVSMCFFIFSVWLHHVHIYYLVLTYSGNIEFKIFALYLHSENLIRFCCHCYYFHLHPWPRVGFVFVVNGMCLNVPLSFFYSFPQQCHR